jgi:glycosidase
MTDSLFSPEFQSLLEKAKHPGTTDANPFPSPADWRDQVIYFLMVDRFNNPSAPPKHTPFNDSSFSEFQGGKFSGVQAQLSYIKGLGVGAIWLSPVLKNFFFEPHTYHGYGIHNFLHADPRFADIPANADDELRRLVDAAHEAGLYVILDIVLNHTGDAFAYVCDTGETSCTSSGGAQADFRSFARPISWRDATGAARFPDIATIASPPLDALVWPAELHRNDYFRRQGTGAGTIGDFASLKQFRTDLDDVQRFLIRAYQYVIARFDIDGFRIDTLRYLLNDLPRLFGNSIREFALSIGKKNFFTFGEVFVGDAEQEIAQFIGRATSDQSQMVGVDAALDYPLFFNLKPVVKGSAPPSNLVGMYAFRKQVEANILSSHGDATRYFVTFLDNHDVKERIRFAQQGEEHKYDDQVTLGICCLYCLPGIPCLYYGTEQGLHGVGNDEAVREALWGGPGFDKTSFYYQQISFIAAVRNARPALRYGRFYFRPISGNHTDFGVSTFPNGVLAFSRILNDEEVIVVANTSTSDSRALDVIVDINLSGPGDTYTILYSNKPAPRAPGAVQGKTGGSVTVQEVDGATARGPLNSIAVTLDPMEVQVLGK